MSRQTGVSDAILDFLNARNRRNLRSIRESRSRFGIIKSKINPSLTSGRLYDGFDRVSTTTNFGSN